MYRGRAFQSPVPRWSLRRSQYSIYVRENSRHEPNFSKILSQHTKLSAKIKNSTQVCLSPSARLSASPRIERKTSETSSSAACRCCERLTRMLHDDIPTVPHEFPTPPSDIHTYLEASGPYVDYSTVAVVPVPPAPAPDVAHVFVDGPHSRDPVRSFLAASVQTTFSTPFKADCLFQPLSLRCNNA